jgi:hypothetical protein
MNLTDKTKYWLRKYEKVGRDLPRKWTPKASRHSYFIYDFKKDFKQKLSRRDKEGHFILIKGTICQEEIQIINICVPNTNIPNFIKEALLDLKAQIDPDTMIVEDFIVLFSPIDREFRQKVNKETSELNDTTHQMVLTKIYRVFHSAAAQYTFIQ